MSCLPSQSMGELVIDCLNRQRTEFIQRLRASPVTSLWPTRLDQPLFQQPFEYRFDQTGRLSHQGAEILWMDAALRLFNFRLLAQEPQQMLANKGRPTLEEGVLRFDFEVGMLGEPLEPLID